MLQVRVLTLEINGKRQSCRREIEDIKKDQMEILKLKKYNNQKFKIQWMVQWQNRDDRGKVFEL